MSLAVIFFNEELKNVWEFPNELLSNLDGFVRRIAVLDDDF